MLLFQMLLEIALQLGVETTIWTHKSWTLTALVAHVINQVVTMFVGATTLDATVIAVTADVQMLCGFNVVTQNPIRFELRKHFWLNYTNGTFTQIPAHTNDKRRRGEGERKTLMS